MAGEVAEAVVGGVLVEVVEGRVVEDVADHVVEGAIGLDEAKAVVDELGSDVADDVYAADDHVVAIKDDFEKSCFCAHDLTAGHV